MCTAQPPAPDEVEVTLIGPGYGECVLVHVGYGDWIIVDSCHPSPSQPHPALAYLESIDVDPAEQVRWIVVSHWHDDHVRGLDVLVNACKKARIAMPGVYCSDEFARGVGSMPDFDDEQGAGLSSGARAITRVLSALPTRGKEQKIPRKLSADKPLDLPTPAVDSPLTRAAFALSPSDLDIHRADKKMARLFGRALRGDLERLPECRRNPSSVVVWVTLGETSVLLGADLEIARNDDCGWVAVIQRYGQDLGHAELLKIAHHGSPNGDPDQLWGAMLAKEPIGLMSPWQNGGDHRPRDDDRSRLMARTPNVYLTAPVTRTPTATAAPGDPTMVPLPECGRITARRARAGDPKSQLPVVDRWVVDSDGPAHRVLI